MNKELKDFIEVREIKLKLLIKNKNLSADQRYAAAKGLFAEINSAIDDSKMINNFIFNPVFYTNAQCLFSAVKYNRTELFPLFEGSPYCNQYKFTRAMFKYLINQVNSVAALEFALDLGDELEHKSLVGETILLRAVRKNNFELARYLLLDKHADATVKNFLGDSVIDFAVKNDNIELLRLLLSHGVAAPGASYDAINNFLDCFKGLTINSFTDDLVLIFDNLKKNNYFNIAELKNVCEAIYTEQQEVVSAAIDDANIINELPVNPISQIAKDYVGFNGGELPYSTVADFAKAKHYSLYHSIFAENQVQLIVDEIMHNHVAQEEKAYTR